MIRTLLLIALFLFTPTAAFADDGEDARSTASDFTLQSLDGETVQLSALRGKVVVISFWATWCAPCLQELPFLNELYLQHQDAGLVVLAVSTDGPESLSDVRRVTRRKRWKFPVLLDAQGTATGLLNPRGNNPFTLFIDRQGRIASTHEGYTPGDEEAYGPLIEKLLAEEAP